MLDTHKIIQLGILLVLLCIPSLHSQESRPSQAATDEARLQFKVALLAVQNGDYITAEQKLTDAARLVPGNGLFWYNLAVVQRKLHKDSEALANIRRALGLQLSATDKDKAENLLAQLIYKGPPHLMIADPIKDYGTVGKGDKLDVSFVIKNAGATDLQIMSAKASCKCIRVDFEPLIKPGETGTATAHVDTTDFTGPIEVVTIETNDPTSPTVQLTVRAVVKPYVDAFPNSFLRFDLAQGQGSTQRVTIYSNEEAPFEITDLQAPAGIRVDTIKLAGQLAAGYQKNLGANQNQYQLYITVDGMKVGPIADKILVFTNSKHQPIYPITINGVIRPK